MASVRLTDTARIEGFSDAVFAISITLLVLDLAIPKPGEFVVGLLNGWPTYVAYLTAFVTIASVWLHHHTVFTRVARVRPSIVVLNLVVLLGVSLLPWPTRLIGEALRDASLPDQTAAITVFGITSLILSAGWISLSLALDRHPELLQSKGDAAVIRANARRTAWSVAPAVAAIALGFFAPLAALAIYLLTAVAFLMANTRAAARGGADDEDE